VAGYVVCRLPYQKALLRFRRLERFVERLVGLLGTDAQAEPVALCRCSSIHTFGMTYAIDVAFVQQDGYVVLSQRALGPGRLLSAAGAYYVLERPASAALWPKEGMLIRVDEADDVSEALTGAK